MDRTRYCINWDLCALCQLENTNEKLVSPVNDKRKDRGSGYKSLAHNKSEEWKDVKLAFSGDIGAALHFSQNHDYNTEALHPAKAAMLVKKELLNKKKCFNDTFDTACQRSAVPHLFLEVVNMILERHDQKWARYDGREFGRGASPAVDI